MLRPYIDMSRFCQLVDNVAKDGAKDGAIDISVGAKHCGQKSGFSVIIYMPQCFALTSSINPMKAKNSVGFRSSTQPTNKSTEGEALR
jgi:hypothetical protein